ncbi:hypothetical protein DIE19_28665 [Burkholderia sp. Bp9126]|nr:hypothetical protein DIE19_28665 [Burkholderia sp. Bp9126]
MFDPAEKKTPTPFVLDDRSIRELLETVSEYSEKIPFEQDPQSPHAVEADEANWRTVLFGQDWQKSLEKLSTLYQDPASAEGELAPQQAFLLAFLKMLETPRDLLNSLPARHRQLYYREMLGLEPLGLTPDQVVLSFQVAKGVRELPLPAGLPMDGGQDGQGTPRQYRLDAPLLANPGRWTDLRWIVPGKVGKPRTFAVCLDEQAKVAWPEGGRRLFAEPSKAARPVITGRVISSPVLALPAGQRTVTIAFDGEVLEGKLNVQLTSKGAWWDAPTPVLSEDKTWSVTLPADAPAIAAAPGLDGYPHAAPLLKLFRNDGQSVPKIKTLTVKVEQSPAVYLGTDEGMVRPDKPWYPFGQQPQAGAALNLVSADWYDKPFPIDVTIKPEWLDLPDKSFHDWYENYPSTKAIADDDVFKVAVQIAQIGTIAIPNNINNKESFSLPLFEKAKSGKPIGRALTFQINPLKGEPCKSVDPRDWPAWVQLELGQQTFLHQEYWQKRTKPAKDGNVPEKAAFAPTVNDLNAPYTPRLKSLKVEYSSTDDCTDKDITRQYQLTAFGYCADDEAKHAEGDVLTLPHLYVGLTGIEPGQDMNLHWQLRSPRELAIRWQYLNQKNQWAPLDATVLDGTNGLFQSGTWYAPLPADASTNAPRMPAGRCWLRALTSLKGDSSEEEGGMSDYPWLVGLQTNCATATLADAGQIEPAHFDAPLPALTITRAVQNVGGLASVRQPWASCGGRGPENEEAFMARVARHLRHRGRALTWQDITDLLTERYPELHGVRQVAPAQAIKERTKQSLLVIPRSDQSDNDDTFRPEFNAARLERMRQFVCDAASPWLNLELSNPDYSAVEVRYNVDFMPHINTDYGQRELCNALQRHYMPWAWSSTSAVPVGKRIDYYDMVRFIQQQPYVRCVHALTLNERRQSMEAAPTQVLILEPIVPLVLDDLKVEVISANGSPYAGPYFPGTEFGLKVSLKVKERRKRGQLTYELPKWLERPLGREPSGWDLAYLKATGINTPIGVNTTWAGRASRAGLLLPKHKLEKDAEIEVTVPVCVRHPKDEDDAKDFFENYSDGTAVTYQADELELTTAYAGSIPVVRIPVADAFDVAIGHQVEDGEVVPIINDVGTVNKSKWTLDISVKAKCDVGWVNITYKFSEDIEYRDESRTATFKSAGGENASLAVRTEKNDGDSVLQQSISMNKGDTLHVRLPMKVVDSVNDLSFMSTVSVSSHSVVSAAECTVYTEIADKTTR